jgi:hypothetical protein
MIAIDKWGTRQASQRDRYRNACTSVPTRRQRMETQVGLTPQKQSEFAVRRMERVKESLGFRGPLVTLEPLLKGKTLVIRLFNETVSSAKITHRQMINGSVM